MGAAVRAARSWDRLLAGPVPHPRWPAARLLLLHARPFRRGRVRAHVGELPAVGRPSVPAGAAHFAPDRADLDRARPASWVPDGLLHRDSAEEAPARAADAGDPALLDELPDPDLLVDRAAQPNPPGQPAAWRVPRRAPVAAVQRGLDRGRPGLRIPPADDPADLLLDRASRRGAARGSPRPVPAR